MNRTIRPIMLATLFCFLTVGCSDSSEPGNLIDTASQEEIDNYNRLIEQAENEMKADPDVEDLVEEAPEG